MVVACWKNYGSAILLTATLFVTGHAIAAMPELVGVVALLVEDQTAKALDLSEDQLAKLNALADERELEGIDAAMSVSGLPANEQREKLAPFRLESQRMGLAILTETQRAKLSELQAKNPNPLYDSVNQINEARAPAEPVEVAEPAAKTQQSETAPEEDSTASPQAAPEETIKPLPESKPSGDGLLSFNFRFQPWSDVLEWFADQSDLSLVLDAPPTGTFNYRDNRRYTVGEAMDVLNNVLQTKGYTLVRKGRMLLLVNLEDEIPPNLVTDVPLEKLDEHGEHELVRVLFRVRSMLPEDLAGELEKLIGPQGKIIVLSKANMVQVTETAGRIRTIRRVIESIDGPGEGDIRELALQHVLVDEALPIIRQMLGIPSDALATPAGTLQLAVDPLGGKIFARGDAKEIARVEEVLRLVDVEGSALTGAALETPQLEVYSTGGADAELVLKVLQTMLADVPGVRIAADAATGNLVALARPSDHATIRATLAQMQQDARQVEVIPLDRVDPSLAKLAVDKLFNTGTDEKPDPRAPIVEVDLTSYSLIVRATPPQMSEIKNLLDQLGDSGGGAFGEGARGNIRVVPLTGAAATSALSQVQQIWPSLRSNKIRVVTPSSAAIPEFRPSDQGGGAIDRSSPFQGSGDPAFDQQMDDLLRTMEQGAGEREPPPPDPSAATGGRSVFRFVAEQQEVAEDGVTKIQTKSGATIIVATGPGGLLLASEDLDALDEFEDLLRSSAGQSTSSSQFAVYYLKYAEASTAAEILGSVFGASGGGGGLMNDIAGAALGDMGGGLMGDLLGLGGGGDSAGFASASVEIVPDLRLNALIVYANPKDLDTVEQLLRIIDQRTGPATVEAGGKPRLIPVHNSSATAVAEVVKQVYQDRLQGAAGGGGQPSPQDLMRMLQRGGGRGGGGGGGGASDQEPSKMSLGVDSRSNSLIVRAPDPLFEEVQLLVKQLDEEGLETPQATRIVSLQHTNAQAVKSALESLLGPDAMKASTPQANSTARNTNPGNNQPNAAQDMQRRMEFFRQLQQRGGGGGGRGGGQPGGRGGRPGGGGRGR